MGDVDLHLAFPARIPHSIVPSTARSSLPPIFNIMYTRLVLLAALVALSVNGERKASQVGGLV